MWHVRCPSHESDSFRLDARSGVAPLNTGIVSGAVVGMNTCTPDM